MTQKINYIILGGFMYQFMILDDEPVVREGIKSLIPWEDYEFELCAEGMDGKDGLKKILEYHPDLVLIDLKMPGMSGIDVIQEAKKHGFQGKFIILTGYSDFQFAKSAISLGVRAYLLKPIDEEELIENISEVYEELESKKHLDDYYTQSELKAKQELIYRLIMSGGDRDRVSREIKTYGLDLRYRYFCVAVLVSTKNYINFNDPEYEDKKAQILRGIENIEKIQVDNDLVIVYKGGTYKNLVEMLKINNERMKSRYGEGFFAAIGQDVVCWEDLHFSYEMARYLSEYQFLYDEEIITIDIFYRVAEKSKDNFAEELQAYIEIGDFDSIHQIVEERFDYYKVNLLKESDVKIIVIHNMILLQNLLDKRYEQKKNELPNFQELSKQIKDAESIVELKQAVIDYSRQVSEIVGSSGIDNVVMRMHAYMEKNYDKDIKLEMIAKMLNYNSAYLGKIYKKQMGKSFNNVLDSIRIENAKRLLATTDMKVYQVSEQIGYSNIDYFFSKFKHYVGITPKEFKRQNDNGEKNEL